MMEETPALPPERTSGGHSGKPPQSYANHRRFSPLFHYVAVPILVANLAISVAHLVRRPTPWNAWIAILAIGLIAGILAGRASTLLVQDRLIGLEMRLRLAATLAPGLRARIPELRLSQLIGLRFASDAELGELVERCLRGELRTADAIKREIREWRPDYIRA